MRAWAVVISSTILNVDRVGRQVQPKPTGTAATRYMLLLLDEVGFCRPPSAQMFHEEIHDLATARAYSVSVTMGTDEPVTATKTRRG